MVRFKYVVLKLFACLSLSLVVTSCCSAQSMSSLQSYLQQFNLKYQAPVGYDGVSIDSVIYGGRLGHTLGRSYYMLKSKKDSVQIYVVFAGPIDTTLVGFKKQDGTIYDPNRNYIPPDTSYVLHDKALTRSRYNADVSGYYNMLPSRKRHFVSANEKCKVVFIHKDNLVDIELYYYYTPMQVETIHKHIKQTESMFKFR